MRSSSIFSTLLLSLSTLGRAAQPTSPEPIAVPLRDLEFGTINFLHTTDTHGWHAGHLLEASYSADWGDYIDFSRRLREKIEGEGNDLLIIDSGDRIEGNGLYDASDPKGKYTFEIFKHQHMDVLTTGNHELYKANSSNNELNIMAPAYPDAYLSSNIDIFNPSTGKWQPIAKRFRKFTTKMRGIRILSFGFLFDFKRNTNNTIVYPVETVVKECWFQEAISDPNIDLIVVAAHATARSSELCAIYCAIRDVKPDIPIHFFAGHLHIRDYKKYDDKAAALASGRFMETIGFASIDGLVGPQPDKSAVQETSTSQNLTFFRRYIDNNLYSFYHHSKTNSSTFHSDYGRSVSAEITAARAELGLDEKYGCAPHDLWVSRVPFPSETSIYTWLNESVFPEAVIDPSRKDKSRIVLCNSGAIRFDIFKGAFTKDEQYIVSPFTSGMHYIKDVPLDKADMVAVVLNMASHIVARIQVNEGAAPIVTQVLDFLSRAYRLAPQEQWHTRRQRLPDSESFESVKAFEHHEAQQQSLVSLPLQVIQGYTTNDDLGITGDDSIHSPIPTYDVDNIIQSYIPVSSSSSSSSSATTATTTTTTDDETKEPAEQQPEVVDLIFNQFLDPYIVLALKFLGADYTVADDVETYLDGESMTDIMTRWIKGNWGMDC